jgi:anti-sigma regulatory factor (Ser/Thr protein kinase)
MAAATTFTKVFFARADREHAIRAWVKKHLRGSDRIDDVVLVAGELTTNVIFHTDAITVSVSLCVTPGEVRLRVTNTGRPVLDNTERLEDLGLPRDDDFDDVGGLGLGIVHALADASGVRNNTPSGHVVWAHFNHKVAAQPAAEPAPAPAPRVLAARARVQAS